MKVKKEKIRKLTKKSNVEHIYIYSKNITVNVYVLNNSLICMHLLVCISKIKICTYKC